MIILYQKKLYCWAYYAKKGGFCQKKNEKNCFIGFVHEQTRLDDETWPEPDPEDPLPIVDEVSMLMNATNVKVTV